MSAVTSRTYARIDGGAVVELFVTAGDMAEMFNPALLWIDATGQAGVAVGWRYDGQGFAPPPPPPAVPPPSPPTLAELQTQLQSLAAQIAALAGHS